MLCDGGTVPEKDLVAVDQVTRKFVGDINYLPFKEDHDWYYESNQTMWEGFIFKSWDTEPNCRAKCEYNFPVKKAQYRGGLNRQRCSSFILSPT